MSHLLLFYGRECEHSDAMLPLIAKLEDELSIKVLRLESWHNPDNAKLLRDCDKGFCGGTPFLLNKKTGRWICGNVDYNMLKSWAK